MMKYSCVLMMFVVAFFLGGPTSLPASDLFTYQGKLTNAGGQTLPGGQYRIGVRVWDVATGGAAPLWSRKYDVAVVDGLFSLMIGAEGLPWPSTPAALTESLKLAVSGSSRYLEITVMSDANGAEKPAAQWQTLAPRQALGAVPYAMNGVPPGTVVPFAGAVIPEGWVRCDGAAYAATDARYAALAATLLTTYGTGGAGTFRVPDLRGRTAIGTGQGDTWGGAGGATNWALAAKFGAEKHQLTVPEMPKHKHNARDTGHTHSWKHERASGHLGQGTAGTGINDPYGLAFDKVLSGKANIIEDDAGEDIPHNNMQPSLVLNYIIKL